MIRERGTSPMRQRFFASHFSTRRIVALEQATWVPRRDVAALDMLHTSYAIWLRIVWVGVCRFRFPLASNRNMPCSELDELRIVSIWQFHKSSIVVQ
jgi:hypothetical protein